MTNDTKEIEYKGWTIREATEPWAMKYGHKFEYFNDENLYYAKTLEEAKLDIDERTYEPEENEN